MITVGEVVEWIWKNKTDAAFKDYTIHTIYEEIVECATNNSMLCVTDSTGIVGVICCCKNSKDKIMFVYDILTTKKGVVKQMLQYFIKNYPDYKLEGRTRTGKKRFFKDIVKLERKIR